MAKKFFLEQCVTLYSMVVFEADSIEEARQMRDSSTQEFDRYLDEQFLGRTVTKNDLQNVDYVDLGEVDWNWDGPVISNEEFKKKFTSLEG